MTFEVSQETFSGPLQLLLELIEKDELPITEVSLAQVTEEYLDYIGKRDVPPEELVDFLLLASRLLYLKSKAILPKIELEDEEDGGRLVAQLKMYKEFIAASKNVEALFKQGVVMHFRPKTKVLIEPRFSPTEQMTKSTLQATMAHLMKKLQPFFSLRETSMRKVVSVQQKIQHIQEFILDRVQSSFHQIIGSEATRVDAVVSFLALLELMKQEIIHASQEELFKDIKIKRVE